MKAEQEKSSIFKDFKVDAVHDPVVEIKNLVKNYDSLQVVKGISMTVKKGETAVIIGPSGGGKSTLLRCIHSLTPINNGEIRVDGEIIGHEYRQGKLVKRSDRQVAEQRAQIGMVFQRFNLFPHRTAARNITEAPIYVKGIKKKEAYDQAIELLDAVGLKDKKDEYPAQLSGGQQQRVAIARALAMRPKLMLYDEATSALDPELIGEVLEVMKAISNAGITSIVVTHEMGFAREVGDQLYLLAEGKIIEQGVPEDMIKSPKNERTQRFLRTVL